MIDNQLMAVKLENIIANLKKEWSWWISISRCLCLERWLLCLAAYQAILYLREDVGPVLPACSDHADLLILQVYLLQDLLLLWFILLLVLSLLYSQSFLDKTIPLPFQFIPSHLYSWGLPLLPLVLGLETAVCVMQLSVLGLQLMDYVILEGDRLDDGLVRFYSWWIQGI